MEPSGRVLVEEGLVRFIRPGLIEEYSTSMDGVRQDFLVLERPEGEGDLRVELAVDGARAEEARFGARLPARAGGKGGLIVNRIQAPPRERPLRLRCS